MELFLKPLLVRSIGPSTFLKLPARSALANVNSGRAGEVNHIPRAEVKVRIEHSFCTTAKQEPCSFTFLTMENYQDALASLADRYLASVPSSKSSDESTPPLPDQPQQAERTPEKSVEVLPVSPSPKRPVRQVRRHDQGAWVTK